MVYLSIMNKEKDNLNIKGTFDDVLKVSIPKPKEDLKKEENKKND